MEYDAAIAKLEEIGAKYGATRSARQAQRLSTELAVIGVEAGTLSVEKWFSISQTTFDAGSATFVIFWEQWCPHCKREAPKLEQTYQKYRDRGLNMVALTQVTKSSTDESVSAFVQEAGLTYPVGKEDGQFSARFSISGIPAAVVLQDGVVVWRGHPARVSDQMLETWLGLN